MKHSIFALLKAAILGRFNINSDAPDKKQNSTSSPSTELKTINVQKDFEGNGFTTVTVYVAPARYTYEFMERYPRFTIMHFSDPEIEKYLGSHSGRDGDKASALGLHVAYTEHGTPYYSEADLVIECETITALHQTPADFRNDTPKKWYADFSAGVHTLYIGEVIGAWKR